MRVRVCVLCAWVCECVGVCVRGCVCACEFESVSVSVVIVRKCGALRDKNSKLDSVKNNQGPS